MSIALWIALIVVVSIVERWRYRQTVHLNRLHWKLGVVQGHGATRWPGAPMYREAREYLDTIEAEVMEQVFCDPNNCGKPE